MSIKLQAEAYSFTKNEALPKNSFFIEHLRMK